MTPANPNRPPPSRLRMEIDDDREIRRRIAVIVNGDSQLLHAPTNFFGSQYSFKLTHAVRSAMFSGWYGMMDNGAAIRVQARITFTSFRQSWTGKDPPIAAWRAISGQVECVSGCDLRERARIASG